MAQMKAFVQILGSATGDSGPTILLWFDKKRYLFNCSEGTQRFCSEHHVRASKMDTFFITRLAWENVGGIAGLLFTVANVGAEKIHVFGPPNTLNFLEAMRYFLSRRKLTIDTKEFRDISPECNESYVDEFVKIYPIPLVDMEQAEDFRVKFPSTKLQSSTELRNQDELAVEHEGKPTKPASQINKLDATNYGLNGVFNLKSEQARTLRDPATTGWPPRKSAIPPLRKLTKDTLPLNAVVCYTCHAADIPGKFDVTKANALGVPVKQRSLLVKGQPVILPDGTTIRPEDCISASTPGKVFIIVDCPNVPILNSLVASKRFELYQKNGDETNSGSDYHHVACIIHITPSDILTSPQYQTWMNKFHPDNVEHLIINSDHCGRPFAYRSSAKLQILLNHIHPRIFPLQYFTDKASLPIPISTPESQWPAKLIPSEPMMRFCLAPPQLVSVDKAQVLPNMDHAEILKVVNDNPDFKLAYEQLQVDLLKVPAPPVLDPVDVLFLGTGSATPSKYRNMSSTYINVKNYGGILMDTGEGTLGQLSRHFGTELDNVISNLKCIFISHMHADHHLGLIRIILRHQLLASEPILVIGPPLLRGWLWEYSQIEPLRYVIANAYEFLGPPDTDFVPADQQSTPSSSEPPKQLASSAKEEVLAHLLESLGLALVELTTVIHCHESFGVTLVHRDGWKIVFSGDTRPCPLLERSGQGATLVIHEATFEDSLADEAFNKSHTTTSGAIESANKMNAKFLMMTHFSQRYPKIPSFETPHGTGAGIAFDLMTMKFSDFEIIPKLRDCLQLLFSVPPGDDDDDEELPSMD